MSMTVEITAHPEWLHVVAGGKFSLDEATRTFLKITDAIEKYRSEKILFDGSGIRGEVAIIERFYYGEFVAGAVRRVRESGELARNPLFAYVLPPPVGDPQRFGEIVATNRGMNVKTFDTVEEAAQWLGVSPEEI